MTGNCARCGAQNEQLTDGLKVCTVCNQEIFSPSTSRRLVEQIFEASSPRFNPDEPESADLYRAMALGEIRRAAHKLLFDFKTVLRVERPRAV